MKGYYIKETRIWKDRRYYDIEEVKYYGRKKSVVQPTLSKSVSGLYIYTSLKVAFNRMMKLGQKAKSGWYESKWEIICEDIQ